MIRIPSDIDKDFKIFLLNKGVPKTSFYYYCKWLQYYLDFCQKYNFQQSEQESLSQFINKLQEKNQTLEQQKQASHSISLYYELMRFSSIETKGVFKKEVEIKSTKQEEPNLVQDKWKKLYINLKEEIKIRHYSPKTLKTYSQWVRQFQGFMRNKEPQSLSNADVKEFLTFLAVKRKVAASTQNQAFNALLFLFRHVINKEFGNFKDVVRAKRKPYIPVVLSREEIDNIIEHLSYPYNLITKLLYGCGLRLFECLNLRVHNFNFDNSILTIHDGKGQKDRTVPIPEKNCKGTENASCIC